MYPPFLLYTANKNIEKQKKENTEFLKCPPSQTKVVCTSLIWTLPLCNHTCAPPATEASGFTETELSPQVSVQSTHSQRWPMPQLTEVWFVSGLSVTCKSNKLAKSLSSSMGATNYHTSSVKVYIQNGWLVVWNYHSLRSVVLPIWIWSVTIYLWQSTGHFSGHINHLNKSDNFVFFSWWFEEVALKLNYLGDQTKINHQKAVSTKSMIYDAPGALNTRGANHTTTTRSPSAIHAHLTHTMQCM